MVSKRSLFWLLTTRSCGVGWVVSGNVHVSRENVLRKVRHGEAALPQEADQRLRSWGSLHRNFLPTEQTGHITDYCRADHWFPLTHVFLLSRCSRSLFFFFFEIIVNNKSSSTQMFTLCSNNQRRDASEGDILVMYGDVCSVIGGL